ncbi:MAG: dUTP diphosphatase [Candidatus Omnitrophota bacterium]
MKLKIKLLDEKAIVPRYHYPGDAGLDLFSIECQEILPGESAGIRTGIAIELPEHTEAQIRPRSGLALNHQITLLNTPGTIDQGYRGEIRVIMINHGKKPFTVNEGMKIAQMVIHTFVSVDVEVTDELSDTHRCERGFGSSGL